MRRGGARAEGGRPRNPGQGTKNGRAPSCARAPQTHAGAGLPGTASALVGRRQVSAWASVSVQRPRRPTWRLCRAVSLGSPSAGGVGSPQGTQSAREPTGGARELPPEPCAGLRPLARPPVVSGSLPGPLGSRGDKTHPASSPQPRAPAGPEATCSAALLSTGPSEARRRLPSSLEGAPGAWSAPSLWLQTGWAPRSVPERWRGTWSSSLSPFSWGESAFPRVHMGTSSGPAQPRWPLCPGCQLERIT